MIACFSGVILIYNTFMVFKKMDSSLADIRKLLRYEFLRGTNASEAIRISSKVHEANFVSESVAYEWYSKFRSGDSTVNDQQRSGRSRKVDQRGVVKAIEEVR